MTLHGEAHHMHDAVGAHADYIIENNDTSGAYVPTIDAGHYNLPAGEHGVPEQA